MVPFRTVVCFSFSFYALLVLPCLATTYEKGPYNFGLNAQFRLPKRQVSQSTIVEGLPLVNGTIPLRPDIRELQKDEDKWNLYILALNWMQYTDQSSPFSWYQIAGIHGAPGSSWGDVGALPGHEGNGYCQHVSILFPTWHRPYVALYEQIVYNIIQFIASIYPLDQRDRFEKAAFDFRLPYWDWAANPPDGETVLPFSIGGNSTIEVSGPNGVQTISNPLFSFTFKPLNASAFTDSPFNVWNETKRAPYPISSPDAVSNDSSVTASYESHMPGYQQRIYTLFANYNNYTEFSNEGWIADGSNGSYDSLESIHDSVHLVGGGGFGHFAIIIYSAYDPLFFLHHANVDRILAMWQVIHNDTYVEPRQAVFDGHTTSAGDIQDAQTSLTPFFNNTTSFWTSESVRDHEVFGYSYADVAGKNRTDVIAIVNRLYTQYSPATMSLRRAQTSYTRDLHPDDAISNSNRSRGAGSKSLSWNHQTSAHLPLDAVLQGRNYNEWIANVVVKKHALGASFSICLFIGGPPDNPASWATAENLVGTLGVFAGGHPPSSTGSGIVAGTIPLTSALMSMIASRSLASLNVADVKPYLSTNLNLGIALNDGTMVNARDIDGLRVSIASSLVKAPQTEHALAEWGEVESHFDLFA
ncbi:Di-copper centre-containing protein [Xylariaceae sp. FL0016]|nr:Di-copper centre-containing protein [Xylariaceae sp. FL0016]